MKIALLSDIHGNLAALQAVLQDVKRRRVDRIVNLGDSLSGPLLPLQTAQFLMAQDWAQLAGNHERQLLDFSPERGPSDRYAHAELTTEVFTWMATLPSSLAVDEEIFICHGTPRSDAEYFLDTVEGAGTRPATDEEIELRCDLQKPMVIACGHTHIPRILRSRSGQLLVNPGSVGLQAYEEDQPHYHLVQNGSPEARYALLERGQSRWHAKIFRVPYDHVAMANLAHRRGRPDWEIALLSGTLPRIHSEKPRAK